MTTISLINANSLSIPLAAGSVHMIATSPPYWGLRDYGLATWEGGDAECDHLGPPKASSKSTLKNDGRPLERVGQNDYERAAVTPYRDACAKCGAIRHDAGLGLEPLHDCLGWARGENCGTCYVCRMRLFAAECWRVLRDDGCMFLNLGDSYSTGKGSNVLNILNRLIEGSVIVIRDAASVATAAHSVEVALDNERSPDGVFSGLFTSERDGVEYGDKNLGQVLHLFRSPSNRGACAADSFMVADISDTDRGGKVVNHGGIVCPDLNAERKPVFGILRSPGTWASENNETSFTVNQANKPGTEHAIIWHSVWNTFAVHALGISLIDVNAVNDPVPFGYGLDSIACNSGDFRITKATEQEVFFSGVRGGFEFRISNVGHLLFSFNDGSIIPYNRLYKQASQQANMAAQKQEMGIPDSVKKALQADGWICRSTIIWAKPNPMPESVTDRATKSHEYIFLLTKQARYFWDADAVREGFSEKEAGWIKSGAGVTTYGLNGQAIPGDACQPTSTLGGRPVSAGRNLRTVWNIATQPYSGSHFATWPEKLVEPMVKAGTSEAGCCSVCGKQWERVVEKSTSFEGGSGKAGRTAEYANSSGKWAGQQHGENIKLGPVVSVSTLGFRPTCNHDAPAVPCTVLDPFAGSGTTGVVSRRLGRSFVGLDLSLDYLRDQARARLSLDTLDDWHSGNGKATNDDLTDLPLFANWETEL